uniref:HAT C-terminal dimerisation domain-containing protein n=1 Tax=Salmo trutta TaxID=8032 RepID=A0A674BUJ9_SALTR
QKNSFSKIRKVDNECRVFQQEWTSKYFFIESVAVLKDYNLSRHFQTKHKEKYRNMSSEQRASRSKELLSQLQKQQGLFTKLHAANNGIASASYVLSHKIAKHGKPFAEGEFLKECLLDTVAILLALCAEDIAENMEQQLKDKVKDFTYFSLALNESSATVARDTAQLLIFLRGITPDFEMTEELASVQSMKSTTTGKDLLQEVNKCVAKQFVSLLEETESGHADLIYHTNGRWLSLGKVLKRVWDLKSEIAEFLQMKGKCGFPSTMYSLVKAFKGKLLLLTRQVEANNLTHLPTLLVCSLSDDQREKYALLLRALNGEFSRRFEDFIVLENDMLLVSSPFTFNVDNAPTDLQLELIDLQSDAVIGELFKTISLTRFYGSLDEQNFPMIKSHAQKMFVLFGSTYVCEQTFSVMKYNKSRHRSSLTDSHLSAILRIATSETTPDFTALVNAHQRLHSSH